MGEAVGWDRLEVEAAMERLAGEAPIEFVFDGAASPPRPPRGGLA